MGEILHFSEKDGFSLAVAIADHFPLEIITAPTSISPSVSSNFSSHIPEDLPCALLLFSSDENILHQETVQDRRLEFTGLMPCNQYTVCLTIGEDHSICATTVTDPTPPSNLTVITSSSDSVTISWDKPALGRFDWFLLKIYLFGQRGEAGDSLLQSYNLMQSGTAFVVDELPACQKVNISLAAVCEAAAIKTSQVIYIIAVTAPIMFKKVTQIAGSTDSYSVAWSVTGDPSEVTYDIYKSGVLQLSQKLSEYMSAGLKPCTQEILTVEAVCRDGSVADRRTITVATAPEMITALQYKCSMDGGFFSWHAPPTFHLIFISIDHILTSVTRKAYHLVTGLASCTQYQYKFEAVCGRWRSKAVIWTDATDCPVETSLSVYKSAIMLPGKMCICIHFPWKFADYMDDPSSRAYQELSAIAKSKILELFLNYGEFPNAEVELLYMVKNNNTVEMGIEVHFNEKKLNLSTTTLVQLLPSLNHTTVFIMGDALFWNDEDECTNTALNNCPENSDCINTFDSFTCICHQGFYDIHDVGADHQAILCTDHGIFTTCEMDLMKVSISKEFLMGRVSFPQNLILNDGSCAVKEEPEYYTFIITETKTYCGGQLLMNETHIIFQHIIINKYYFDSYIIREDPLTLVWKCVYLRNSFVKMSLPVPLPRRFEAIVHHYTGENLQLAISLYKDDSFSADGIYEANPIIHLNDELYLEVKLSVSRGSFAARFVLEVLSCWATITSDPQADKKFYFLQDGCPEDETFRWHDGNGASGISRFSIKMFRFSNMANAPIYIHCQAKICDMESTDSCLTECPTTQVSIRSGRNALKVDSKQVKVVVSVGPIEVWIGDKSEMKESGNVLEDWEHLEVVLCIVGGVVGIGLLIIFATVVFKNVMSNKTKLKTSQQLNEGQTAFSNL
eukprot:gi/632955577/ref/XP_007893532.1/ PREDICTED: uncharacterized protein LOC103179855 isoform X2 [Callorhinchus milii]